MLVLSRFRVPAEEAATFRAQVQAALEALSKQPGYVEGRVGRSVDDPGLWVLQTVWEGPGAYRRALSSYEVKVRASVLLGTAVDEPGAYELVQPGQPLNEAEPRETS